MVNDELFRYSPIGIAFLIASKIMDMERPEEILGQLGLYMATVLVGLFVHGLIFLPIIYLIVVRKNPITYILGASQVSGYNFKNIYE